MSTSRMLRLVGLCTLLVACGTGVAMAQSGAASITGLVTDETGGALPGVTITATHLGTNVPYTAVSNEAGNYTITPVPIGTYTVKAELTGFRTASASSVTGAWAAASATSPMACR